MMLRELLVLLIAVVTVSAGVAPVVATASGGVQTAGGAGSTALGGPARPAATTTATQVTIHEIQTPKNKSTGASEYAGQTVTTTGVVTAVRDDGSGYYIQNGTGKYSGVFVYTGGSSSSVSVGDTVKITALVKEFSGLTELDVTASSASVTVTGTASVPAPTTLDTGNVSQEAYEGVLVAVEQAKTTALPGSFGEWTVNDGSGNVTIDDVTTGDSTVASFVGETFTKIVGPVTYNFGAYKIQPKTATSAFDGTTLTVLAYTDIGSEAAGDGTMGRFITLINQRRAAAPGPVVVVGNGDEISPHALRGKVTPGWAPPIKALNIIDPAAEAVQNHELDYDEAQNTGDFSIFENASEASNFPWLQANVRKNGHGIPGTQNHTVVQRGNLTIGIFSVMDSAINTKAGNVLTENGYTIKDYKKIAKQQAQYLTQQANADVVIALTPIGNTLVKQLARNTTNIDVFVTGDRDSSFPPTRVGGAIVTHPPGGAQGIAEIKVRIENGSIVGLSGVIQPVTDSLTRNATWADYIDDIRAKYGLDEVIASTEIPLSTKPDEYTQETALGNLITTAIKEYSNADVALTNAGGIRGFATFYPNVTKSNIRSTLSFGNDLVTVRVTGAQLRDILASQIAVHQVPYGPSHGIQVAGVTMEWIPHNSTTIPYEDEGFGQIADVYVNGEPLDPNETYVLATNRYIAEGGSDFPMNKSMWIKRYNVTMAQAVISWLNKTGHVTREMVAPAVQGRLRMVDRSVNATAAEVDVKGGEVGVTVEVAEAVTKVTSEFYLRNATDGRVNATSVVFNEFRDTVTVTFALDDWQQTFSGENGADIYGLYYDSEYTPTIRNRTTFEWAVYNVDVSAGAMGPDPLPGFANAPTDPDGDGIYEDVNGDGAVNIADVQALFANRNSDAVRNNEAAFDFNGDGDFNVADVQRFFQQVS